MTGPEMSDDQPPAEPSFETALHRLEEIVQRLERGQEPIDVAIALYAEGDRLRARCEATLKAAEARIEQIVTGNDGRAVATAPFDAG